MQQNVNILASLSRLDKLCKSGYAIALHIRFTTPKFLFQTYDREWMKIYSEQGLVLKDPTVSWGFSNTGVMQWDRLVDIDESGVLEQAKQYGLKHGFTFAVDLDESKSIASFARHDRNFSKSEVAEISDIILGLHNYTAKLDGISPQKRDQLKEMSVEFTHG